jgi:hypothetical protein
VGAGAGGRNDPNNVCTCERIIKKEKTDGWQQWRTLLSPLALKR